MQKVLFSLILVFCSTKSIDYLDQAAIQEIYQRYIKPIFTDEYRNRYVPLPLHKNNIPGWKWEGKDFARVISLLEFERFVKKHNIASEKGLAINGINDPEWYYISYKERMPVNYLDNPQKYDLHILDLPIKDFDFVMINQTLEHVYNPLQCLLNVYQHMRQGGILYINVPANNMPHDTPWHYYTGYTASGLAVLVKAAGFTILEVGQWGNNEYLRKMFELNDWPHYQLLSNPGINDFNCPIIVWVFAYKP